MQQSNKSFVYQAFQASSLMYLFLDQVWWFFKLVVQCKLWLATTVAHLVKPATLKHHATKQQIICLSSVWSPWVVNIVKQDVIFLSSVSSIKLDVPYSWLSVVVLQVGSTVQTMIGYHCAHLVRPVSTKHHATKQDVIFLSSVCQVWCTLFLTKCGGSSSW